VRNAESGVKHWWAQRLTAIALVPLTVWFVAALIRQAGAGRAELIAWLSDPVAAVLMILFLAAGLYHGVLGIQEVILDYVHAGALRHASLIALKLFGALLIVASVFAVLLIAAGR
jgi:succinate dehydrogenase membrane anchor subunit